MRTDYNTKTSTPWGQADSATRYSKGVIFYSTPSHGGFHLSVTALRRVPQYLQTADKYADGTKGWFEEDCASSIVIACFPELFTAEERESARYIMKSTYPAQYEAFHNGTNHAPEPLELDEHCHDKNLCRYTDGL